MDSLVIVDRPQDWPLEIPGTRVITARDYLNQSPGARQTRVLNLCRSYAYQSVGYYVSLLAAARGHRVIPDVMTMQDLRTRSLWKLAGSDLAEVVTRSLKPLSSDEFVVSVYFGRNLARRYDRLARQLYNLFPAPLLRARFKRDKQWELVSLKTIALGEVPETHREFLYEAAADHFAHRLSPRRSRRGRYDLAILRNPEEAQPPSNPKALEQFVRAGEKVGFNVAMIDRNDYGRLAEFDALFIRETTLVNHHTYRFARRAAMDGLIVMDDPDSILRCTNKVFLAELLERQRIPAPRSMIVTRDNADQLQATLGLPCVLKQPDGAFSAGVIKVESAAELKAGLARFFKDSELVLAQGFVPTEFDWRIGVLAGQPLYACRYYMADAHWQIYRRDADGHIEEGNADTVPIDEVPGAVLDAALRAARAIGDGLYGVDLKAVGTQCQVIEVNDNPNIDAGIEDAMLGSELYERIMREFMQRVQARKGNHS